MNCKKLFSFVLVVFMLFAFQSAFCMNAFAVGEEPETSASSVEENSGFVSVDGKVYYFNPETHEKFVSEEEGVYPIGEKHYYFNADSSVFTAEKAGAYQINGVFYLFDSDNSVMHVGQEPGFVTLDGGTYYAEATGKLKTGLVPFNAKYYYFDPVTAKMQKGLKKVGKYYYFFDTASGIMKTGLVKDSKGAIRFFDLKTGKMRTGLVKYNNAYYYFDTTSGVMKNGFVKDSKGVTRFFGLQSGKMLTGLIKYNNKYYYFDPSNGAMKTGFVKDSKGRTRCFNTKTGAMCTGLTKYGNYYYYFDTKTGYMKTGLITTGTDKRYFSTKNGRMLTGWLKLDGNYYYFSTSSGKMLKSTIVGKYYVLSNGKRATSKAVSYAVSVVNAVSTSSMTREQKLRACFNWIVRNCSYARDYTDPARLNYNWTKSYAEYLFANKKGNCYKYASAMGYCAAVLGYPSKVAYGKISSNHGMTNHGWTEVVMDGKTYIFDTVQADYSQYNYYKRTYSNYPKKLQKNGTRSIVLS